MQLAFDLDIQPPKLATITRLKSRPTGLTCSLCRRSDAVLGMYPQPAGTGWRDGVNFHPSCQDDLAKYGAD